LPDDLWGLFDKRLVAKLSFPMYVQYLNYHIHMYVHKYLHNVYLHMCIVDRGSKECNF
jgi:hypothetical protein